MLLTFEVVWRGEGFLIINYGTINLYEAIYLFSLFTTMHNMLD